MTIGFRKQCRNQGVGQLIVIGCTSESINRKVYHEEVYSSKVKAIGLKTSVEVGEEKAASGTERQ